MKKFVSAVLPVLVLFACVKFVAHKTYHAAKKTPHIVKTVLK